MKLSFRALMFSAVSLVALGAVDASNAAPPAGSCLGGCLPTALSAPTPVFPVGYECRVNWPFANGHAPCTVVMGRESNYTITRTVTKTVNDDGSVTVHEHVTRE